MWPLVRGVQTRLILTESSLHLNATKWSIFGAGSGSGCLSDPTRCAECDTLCLRAVTARSCLWTSIQCDRTYIVDSAPVSPSRLAATIASSTPSVGLTIGALSSGAKRTGMVVFFLAVVGGIVTLQTKAVVPFILASIVDGVAQRTALSGSILAPLMCCSYSFRKCGGKHNYGANTSAGLDASNAFRQLDSVDQQCTRCQRSGVF